MWLMRWSQEISAVSQSALQMVSLQSFAGRNWYWYLPDVLLNVFEAVDVIELLKGGDYSNLNWSVGRALAQRNPNHPGVYTCSLDDGLDTIFDTIRKSRVHRLTIVDENNILKGVLSLSDILHYILVEGEESKHWTSREVSGDCENEQWRLQKQRLADLQAWQYTAEFPLDLANTQYDVPSTMNASLKRRSCFEPHVGKHATFLGQTGRSDDLLDDSKRSAELREMRVKLSKS